MCKGPHTGEGIKERVTQGGVRMGGGWVVRGSTSAGADAERLAVGWKNLDFILEQASQPQRCWHWGLGGSLLRGGRQGLWPGSTRRQP